jgi:hypothetical protein
MSNTANERIPFAQIGSNKLRTWPKSRGFSTITFKNLILGAGELELTGLGIHSENNLITLNKKYRD